MRPSRTEAIAGSASVFASANHWSVSIGSMTTPERSPKGCMIFLFSTKGHIVAFGVLGGDGKPSALIASTIRLRAS